MAASNNPPKDTIYIDVDEEITGIIDKLRGSEAKIVALVLPKRASVFQSIVNMKLVKRAADDAKKHIVLITTESGLLPLAGAAGVLVASTLTSKPEIPAGPVGLDDQEETVDEATGETSVDLRAPVGELAGIPATDDVETIEMDDESPAPEEEVAAAAGAAAVAAKVKKPKKDSKLAVPNFERFRLLLILGVLGLIVLIVGLVMAMTVLPKATIAITTDATNVNTNVNFTADSAANTFDADKNVLPAKLVSQQKTYTQQGAATGQKNNGDKASGQVKIVNCSGEDITVPAGTGISSGSYTFITQNSVVVPDSDYKSPLQGGTCKNTGTNTVNVKAQTAGSAYNLAANSKFTLAGYGSGVTGSNGSDFTGGTDNITKIVTQADIDNAKAKITTTDTGVKSALESELTKSGLYPLSATFNAGTPAATSSVNAGDAADTVTVTENVTYTMLGVQQSDLKTLVDANVKKQIDTSKQSILDEGLRGASFDVTSNDGKSAQVTMQTVAVAGPHLDVATIRKNAAGKKSGVVKTELQSNPDVTGVDIKLSPFFVSHIPKKTDKITVTIAKPKVTVQKTNADTNP